MQTINVSMFTCKSNDISEPCSEVNIRRKASTKENCKSNSLFIRLDKTKNASLFCLASLMFSFSCNVAFVSGFTIFDATENLQKRSGRQTAVLYAPQARCVINYDVSTFVFATFLRHRK